ncbi:Transcription factor [Dionaea muscipula]
MQTNRRHHHNQRFPANIQSHFAAADFAAAAAPEKKQRRIVTWTPQEDDILREQISIHGTENWSLIASNFNDKTTRQCRRRWYTYLNTDFKKGGWSPEEDMLLCEAQKIFGNKWTEIAKVVSGRTDNAVKNRFSTLCKKRAKCEALVKENNNMVFINSNSKRVVVDNELQSDGTLDVPFAAPCKKMRSPEIPDIMKMCNKGNLLVKDCGTARQHPRTPLAALAQKFHDVDNFLPQNQFRRNKFLASGEEKIESAFLRKDDPKIAALMQQAELLSSLALKMNAENTEQSLENAWKVLQTFLHKSEESEIQNYEVSGNLQVDDVEDLMEELKRGTLDDLKDLVADFQMISYEVSQPSQRNLDFHESPGSSQYSSTESTVLSAIPDETVEQNQSKVCTQQVDTEPGLKPIEAEDEQSDNVIKLEFLPGEISNEEKNSVPNSDMEDNGVIAALSTAEFSSPLHVTPLFRSLAASIPSPRFSESEQKFLMRTLGIQSPTPPSSSVNPSQPPLCRRALVHSL